MNTDEFDFTDPRALRRKAEEILKRKQVQTDRTVPDADVKKLLHELQVHQIELEMQNEELRLANETAEAALKKYTMLYDLSPLGYLTIERDGRISELNFTAAELLGERRINLVDSTLALFIAEESKPAFSSFLRRVFKSHAKESCQVMLSYADKPLCQVYLEGVVIADDNRCLLSIIDISSFS